MAVVKCPRRIFRSLRGFLSFPIRHRIHFEFSPKLIWQRSRWDANCRIMIDVQIFWSCLICYRKGFPLHSTNMCISFSFPFQWRHDFMGMMESDHSHCNRRWTCFRDQFRWGSHSRWRILRSQDQEMCSQDEVYELHGLTIIDSMQRDVKFEVLQRGRCPCEKCQWNETHIPDQVVSSFPAKSIRLFLRMEQWNVTRTCFAFMSDHMK
jgi:hypothetical protein